MRHTDPHCLLRKLWPLCASPAQQTMGNTPAATKLTVKRPSGRLFSGQNLLLTIGFIAFTFGLQGACAARGDRQRLTPAARGRAPLHSPRALLLSVATLPVVAAHVFLLVRKQSWYGSLDYPEAMQYDDVRVDRAPR